MIRHHRFGFGGYVWDDVLEYQVWCRPNQGAIDFENADDYFRFIECGKKLSWAVGLNFQRANSHRTDKFDVMDASA